MHSLICALRVVAAGFGLALAAAHGGLNPIALIPRDVGSPELAGLTTNQPGVLEIRASGSGIGALLDQFHFAYQPAEGDFDVKVRIAALDPADLWSKAGLMVRKDPTHPASMFAGVFATPSSAGCVFQWRPAEGSNTVNSGSFPANQPLTWLRLQRMGDQISGFASYDGFRWERLGATVGFWPTNAWLGLAVTSRATNRVVRAEFRDLADATGNPVEPIRIDREPLGPSTRRTGLVISEIQYHPLTRPDGPNLEYVEIHNTQPYFEDISGHRLAGDIQYTFPPGTVLPAGGFVLVSAKPQELAAARGLSNVMGPWKGDLPNGRGLVQLWNERGGLYLNISYRDSAPWPVLADGLGHSLVLARPSYGEEDPYAWAASTFPGGSPGAPDPVLISPLDGLLVNEVRGGVDGFVELYNHDSQPLDAERLGVTLWAGDRSIAVTGILAPRAHWTAAFPGLTKGTRVYLEGADGRRFEGMKVPATGATSFGRSPDGGSEFRALAAATPGTRNVSRLVPLIVLNELHYHPISGDDNEQFVELYNPGSSAVSLRNWHLSGGVDFKFSASHSVPARGYLVIARNQETFLALHTNLTAARVVGDFKGRLSHAGERVQLKDSSGVVVEDVTYHTGGRWGRWHGGGGSSLERVDWRADPRLPSAWGESDESRGAEWTTIEASGIAEGGSAYGGSVNALHLLLLGEGECQVDTVQVQVEGGTNRITNADFESGLSGWVAQGNHIRSSLETRGGFTRKHSLHVRASGNGDTGPNCIRVKLNPPVQDGDSVTLRAHVRWLAGWPELLLRLNGNFFEAYGKLPHPIGGTPGLPNSRSAMNSGPAIADVAHFPVLPGVRDPVRVTARIDDPDGLALVMLNYRPDPGTDWQSTPMRDDGTHGDAVAGDGVFAATIPPAKTATLVAFYLSAQDASPAGLTTLFPSVVTNHECLIRYGDPVLSGAFGTYRMWLTDTNTKVWSSRPNLSNEPVDGTFVYGSWRVIYNAGGRYAGSPYHQQIASPSSDCHYVFDLPADDRLLGTRSLNKVHAPGNAAFDDSTLQREQTVYWIARRMGLPSLYRRYVNVVLNGANKRLPMEDSQVGNADFVKEYWPEDAEGNLFKLNPWFEFDASNGVSIGFDNNTWATLLEYRRSDGTPKTEQYRWNFLVRAARGTANDYQPIVDMVAAANASAGTPSRAAELATLIDIRNWQTTFAINHAVGNVDSFGYDNGQNMYGYKPRNGPWQLIIWDANMVFENSGADTPSFDQMFTSSDPITDQFYSSPLFRRSYIKVLQELAADPFVLSNAAPMLDAKYAAFQDHGVAADSPGIIAAGLESARGVMLEIVASNSPPFAVTSPGGLSPRSTDLLLTLSGTAPIGVRHLLVNGEPVVVTWKSGSSGLEWETRITRTHFVQTLRIEGVDDAGNALPNARCEVTATYSGTLETPEEVLVFSEIMHRPSAVRGEYVELLNESTNNTFDVSRWRIEPLGVVIPEGTFLAPQSRLVYARDAGVYSSLYTHCPSPNGVFTGRIDPNGDTLRLIQPGTRSSDVRTITAVTYGIAPPWPVLATNAGYALQLREGCHGADDRPGNWAVFQVPNPETNNWVRAVATGSITGTNLLLYLSSFPVATHPDDVTGVWQGKFREYDTPLLFHLYRDQRGLLLANFIYGTETNPAPFPASSVSYQATNRMVFLVQQNDAGNYSGNLSTNGLSITGNYSVHGIHLPFSVTRTLPGGDGYIDDVVLVAGSTAEQGVNLIRNGRFESGLDPDWVVSGSHSGSELARRSHSGTASLRIVANPDGGLGSANSAVRQRLRGVVPGQTYTLSYWYQETTNAMGLAVRFDNGSLASDVDLRPKPRPHLEFTPGLPNTVARRSMLLRQ